jgi:CheY-like chemotaxis protein
MADAPKALRVLLVDDHADTLLLQAMLLRRAGHEVQAVASVAAALQAAGQQPFDLLISDLRLPDGSGIDLMSQIKSSQSGLRGIVVSGVDDHQEKARAVEAGFKHYLLKPILPERLLECVDGFRDGDSTSSLSS